MKILTKTNLSMAKILIGVGILKERKEANPRHFKTEIN